MVENEVEFQTNPCGVEASRTRPNSPAPASCFRRTLVGLKRVVNLDLEQHVVSDEPLWG